MSKKFERSSKLRLANLYGYINTMMLYIVLWTSRLKIKMGLKIIMK